jgi:hypothetical protein
MILSLIGRILNIFSSPETIRRMDIFRAIQSRDISQVKDKISEIPNNEIPEYRNWRSELIGAAIKVNDPKILDLVVNELTGGSYQAKFRDVACSQIGSGSIVTAEYSALGWAIKNGSTTVAFHLVSRDKFARRDSCKRLALAKGMLAIADEIDELSQRQPT